MSYPGAASFPPSPASRNTDYLRQEAAARHQAEMALRQAMYAFKTSFLVFHMANLRLPELLRNGPQTTADLATHLHWDYPNFLRFVTALTATGLLVEHADGSIQLTPMGQLLDPQHPHSLFPEMAMADRVLSHAFRYLPYTIETGHPAFEGLSHGTSFYTFLQQQRELKELFSRFMNSVTEGIASMLAQVGARLFSSSRLVVDVGGGVGVVLATLMDNYPHLGGILLEKPEMSLLAQNNLRRLGFGSDRCQIVPGDFLRQVPSGGDVYILSQILHDWSDEECLTILRNCRQASAPGGTLLIIEAILPDRISGPNFAIDQDLNMMTLVYGQERTEREYADLLAQAGFAYVAQLPSQPFGVLQAQRV